MQLSYSENPGQAFAGMISDTGMRDVISRLASPHQLVKVVVTTAADSEDFTITIDGTAYTYASDTNATKAEITAGLKALIDAGGENVTVTDDTVDTLTIEGTTSEGFTLTVTDGTTGVLTATTYIAQAEAIAFGTVVVEDEYETAGTSCRLPRAAGDITGNKTLGVAVADTSRATRSTSPFGGYSNGDAVPVLRRGRIWMTVEDIASVAKGGLVYVRHTVSGSTSLGAIRAADDGGNTDPIPNGSAQFTGKVSGTVAEVEFNLP